MLARRASVKLLYNSKDISADITPYLEQLTFTDNTTSADDLQITLHDLTGVWKNGWYPAKGSTLKCTIITDDWIEEGKKQELYCGQFHIDEITAQGPNETITIKALSTPVGVTGESSKGAGMRHERKTKAWENTTLKTIAQEVADGSGFSLYYEFPQNPKIDRYTQKEQSDLAMLQTIAYHYGGMAKVSDKKLIIYDMAERQKAEPVATISGKVKRTPGQISKGDLSSWSFTSSCADQYSACIISYYDPVRKRTYQATAYDREAEAGQVLRISQRVESQADAEALAKSHLQKANLSRATGRISLPGNVLMSAGNNITVEGFGSFDGTYQIDSATHTVNSSGYKTDISIHRGEKK